MIRSITRLVTLALVGGVLFSGAAQAQSYPRVVGTGENASVEYGPGPAANLVGGALSRVVGSGENTSVVATEVQHVQRPRAGLTPIIVESGENRSVVWVPGARAAS